MNGDMDWRLGLAIGDWGSGWEDCDQILGVRIRDWKLRMGFRDWRWGLGIRIRALDWGLGLRIRIRDWQRKIGIGD